MKINRLEIEVLDVIYKLQEMGYFRDLDTHIPKNYMVTCPVHKGGNEKKPSFGIHKETGVCHCFTCGWKGSLPQLIHQLLLVDGIKWIENNIVLKLSTTRAEVRIPQRGRQQIVTPCGWVEDFTKGNAKALQYLAGRGITNIENIFPIGYWTGRNSVAFAIRDINGTLGWVKARRLDRKEFYNSKGSQKSKFLYGLYECIQRGASTVWLCESETDCLTCWSRGDYAVATSGATLSTSQVELLRKVGIRTVIDGMDRDTAGRTGWEVFKQLWGMGAVTTDWGDCTKKDINSTTEEEYCNIRRCVI